MPVFDPDTMTTVTDNPISTQYVSTTTAIYTAIGAIQQELGAIPKDQKVAFGNTRFQFRGIDDVQEKLFPLLKRHGVVISCPSRGIEPVPGQEGKLLFLRAAYRFMSLVDGSFIETVSTAFSSTRDDRGLSAAGSTAYKYAIFEFFCVPVKESRDNDQMAEENDRGDRETLAAAPEPRDEPASLDQPREFARAIEALSRVSRGLSREEKMDLMVKYYGVAAGSKLKALDSRTLEHGTLTLEDDHK